MRAVVCEDAKQHTPIKFHRLRLSCAHVVLVNELAVDPPSTTRRRPVKHEDGISVLILKFTTPNRFQQFVQDFITC